MNKDHIIEPDFMDDDLSVIPENDISLTLPEDDPVPPIEDDKISLALDEDLIPADPSDPVREPEDISLTLPEDESDVSADADEELEPISLSLPEDVPEEALDSPDETGTVDAVSDQEPDGISLTLPEDVPEEESQDGPGEIEADDAVSDQAEDGISLTLPEDEPDAEPDDNAGETEADDADPDQEPEEISLTLPEDEPDAEPDDNAGETEADDAVSDQEPEEISLTLPEDEPDAEPDDNTGETGADDAVSETESTADEDDKAPDTAAEDSGRDAASSDGPVSDPPSPDENVPEYDESSAEDKPRRRIAPMIILPLVILVVLATIASVSLWYLSQRSQVKESLEEYLSYVQDMDFDRMESMIQSNDLSALENADITNEIFYDFFRSLNQDMTYTVNRVKLDINNNTARGVGHIRYVDGTEIYKETISEFLKKMVTTAFDGKELTEQETQKKLVDMLKENASNTELTYAEADILYPMVKVDGVWKIVSLDDETVRIMSANFKNVQDEIDRTINGETVSTEEGPKTYVPENGQSLDLSTDQFSIRYNKHVLAKDFAGNPCLLLYYDYTNNSSEVSSAMVDVQISAYQHGQKCPAAIPESLDTAIDQYIKEVKPGETVLVCQAFELSDDTDVTVQAEEAFRLSDDTVHTLVLKFS